MFTVITLCKDVYMTDYGDSAISDFYLADDNLHIFSSKEEAFKAAYSAAEEELEDLTKDFEPDEDSLCQSFNIPEDPECDNMNEVKIYGYDSNGDAYTVTKRIIKEIKE